MADQPKDKTLPISDQEHEQLRRWRSEFQQDFRTHEIWLKQKEEWERFYDGDQLSSDEKKALRERGQPEVVINLIKPRVDGAIGDFLGRRVMMRARDRGSNDFDTAKHITEALRYVEDQTRFDEQEARVAEDLLIGGQGWYKVSLEFDFLEPEIRVNYRENEDIVLDRRSRKRDLSDAKRLYETMWVEVEDLVEMYPQHKEAIRQAAEKERESKGTGNQKKLNYQGDDYQFSTNVTPDTGFDFETFVDPKRNRVRLINVWERVQKKIEFAFHPDLQDQVQEITDLTKNERENMKDLFPGVQIFTRTRWELNSGIFICNKILEENENVRPHDSMGKFPFARAVGHVSKGDIKLPYGIVRQYMDPQKEYNKRRSKLLHKSNTNRIVAERGSFPDNEIERIRKEAARPDGVVLYNPGKAFQVDGDKPAEADVLLLRLSQNEIEVSGTSKEFLGQEDSSISGRAIALRQTEGMKMLRPFFSALRSARRDVFSIVLEEIQQFWTSQKVVKITDDPEAGQLILNQKVADPATGEVIIANNLRLGKYDIKIDEDLETPNQRQESFRNLAQLGQVALQAGEPFPVEMLIKASDLPNKQEWLDAIAQRKQQQLQLLQMQAIQQAGAAPNGQNVTPA